MSRTTLLFSLCAMTLAARVFAQAPATPGPSATPAPSAPLPPSNALVFDAESKEVKVKPGETTAPFTFHATNTWSQPVKITALRPSCGCTAAQLPSMPYELGVGSNVAITVNMDLRGKMGLVTKSLGVETSAGFKSLLLRVDIPQAPSPAVNTPAVAATPAGATENRMGERAKNIQIALNDRQAVFKGDCRTCHVDKGIGKLGKELYDADCGICHDDKHRAAMVPDLKVPRSHRDVAFWEKWIVEGKVGTMMPAFGQEHGGPLTKEQIKSLVSYLYENYPKDPPAAAPQQANATTPSTPTAAAKN